MPRRGYKPPIRPLQWYNTTPYPPLGDQASTNSKAEHTRRNDKDLLPGMSADLPVRVVHETDERPRSPLKYLRIKVLPGVFLSQSRRWSFDLNMEDNKEKE